LGKIAWFSWVSQSGQWLKKKNPKKQTYNNNMTIPDLLELFDIFPLSLSLFLF
jgi:hypothetical protein